ncbi:MAG TPA: hypothetical protein VEB42_03680, partial [Chitinophagaceae bacterium]|nr:hypothetical protein [Chitinophagaceae bacterium]
ISAYLPLIDTGEVQTCPRRMNEFGPWKHEENLDTWKIRGEDKCCSFCGSVHPERVIELVKQHGPQIIQTTDKGYKFYISRPEVPNASFGGIKTYLQHWSEDQVAQYNAILHTD